MLEIGNQNLLKCVYSGRLYFLPWFRNTESCLSCTPGVRINIVLHIQPQVQSDRAKPFLTRSGFYFCREEKMLNPQDLEDFINSHEILSGCLLAFVTSLMRLWRKPDAWGNKLIDSALCMSLTVGLYYGINQLHPLNPNVALCIGSFVGYIGTEQIKEMILKFWAAKTGANNDRPSE